MKTITQLVHPQAPFDFARTLAFLESFPAMVGEQATTGGLTKAVRVDGHTVVFEVVSRGTVAAPALAVTLHARALPATLVERALDRISFFLGLDDDVGALDALLREDPAMAGLAERMYGLHQVKLMTPFENAVWAILGQRCPQPVARAMKQRLVAKFGDALDVAGVRHAAFPAPGDLTGVDEAELAEVLGNPVKARRVAAAARAFAGCDEAFLRHGPIAEVRAWLLAIEGIGPWSAAFVLLRGLGRGEALDGAEEQLAPAVARIYGKSKLTGAGVHQLAARYGRYQGYWAHYIMAGGSRT